MQSPPLVSVLISVHNAEDTLAKSIGSIRAQSFENWELVIVDDGSTDKSPEILRACAQDDARIHVFTQDNTGLTRALNNGIAHCRGVYIARQDADDFSYPHRLARQAAVMEADTSIVLCGGNCDSVYESGLSIPWGWRDDESLKTILRFRTPFAHSTAMIRASVLKSLGGYDPSFKTSQDMELWIRLSKAGKVTMLREPVIKRSVLNKASISARRKWRQVYDAFRARWMHNQDRKFLALYHTARNLIIGCLPHKILALKQNMKS